MKHLGDIAKIHGSDIAPVDVITFGSPCQDLSVAGGQKGMKYLCPACGIEFAITAGAASCPMCGTEIEKTRSGLFIEAVRIIKEMRKKTNGKQPRFAVWENVPGAFSSNKGADFQIVLLELCRVTEPKAPAIAVPKGGWPNAGCLTDVGGGSIAWRTLDAQFHGVPQRRRKIILVCDFAGQCAGQLLFKPSGLPGYPAEGTTYTVRRLTPTECARLQGFPDWWADLPQLEDMTDEAFSFWQEVRAAHAAINGKTYKPVSKRQMVKWYNKLHTDSAEYKMWGNGVALPVVRIPLHGMAQLGAKTMGSLFDGSGGFPLAGLLDGIETLWASEIEPYPIAVTAWNFGGRAQVLLGGVHRNE